MRSETGGRMSERVSALWRSVMQWTAKSRACPGAHSRPAQKLPFIEDIVARAGREPPVLD